MHGIQMSLSSVYFILGILIDVKRRVKVVHRHFWCRLGKSRSKWVLAHF